MSDTLRNGTNGQALSSHPGHATLVKEPLAIIGIGCRLPGGVINADGYWRMLCAGVDAISEIPPERWRIDSYYDPESGKAGKTTSRWGGFLSGIDLLDADFFGISPREAAWMDPQQRLLLEVAYEALEDGGQTLERWAGQEVAVYIGLSSYDYSNIQTDFRDRGHIDVYSNTGGALSLAANRISYSFNFKGPSAIVDTACSSSLVAVHLACQSLWRKESVLALAGGINVLVSPDGWIGFSKLSMLSPDGRCQAFDERANGFVRSEGTGIVVLKPLAQALADGDRIYALIRSTAVNQDGRTPGMTVPSQQSQEMLLRRACQEAGIDPTQIQYVEAHGTGTLVGDPIEVRALGSVLSAHRSEEKPCLIGSVKTNIGHLEPASGIAGLIKTALALHHQQIPAHLHLRSPNPKIPFETLKLRVPQTLEPWPAHSGPALAGVNSFGFGGTNAHAILSDFSPPALPRHGEGSRISVGNVYLLPLSARSPEALQQLAGAWKESLVNTEASGDCEFLSDRSPELCDLCFTASQRRSHHDHRLAVVARSSRELADKLELFRKGETLAGIVASRVLANHSGELAFVFSGQGPQWWAMGRQLLSEEPVFCDLIERCDRLVKQTLGWSLLAELTKDEAHSRIEETAIAQPAIFAVQAALAALWQSWGIRPTAVVGHSIGEVAAAFAAGVLSLEEAVRVICHRGRCTELAPVKGGMLAVELSVAEAQHLLNGKVSLAAINSPASVTLSGPVEGLQAIAHTLEQRNVFHRFLRVNYAFHSAGLEPVRDELLQALRDLQPRPATLPMYSTVTGQRVDGPELDAEYWWQNLRQPVRFAEAMDRLSEAGHQVVVEVGPHPVLAGSVVECFGQRKQKVKVVPSLRRQEEERTILLQSLGTLYTLGYPVAWNNLVQGRFVRLPSYPWQRQSFWHESEESRRTRIDKPDHPLLGSRLLAPQPSWLTRLERRLLPWLDDHRVLGQVVLPGMGYLDMAWAAARLARPAETHALEEVKFLKPCFLSEGEALQTVFQPEDGTFRIYGSTSGKRENWTLHAEGIVRVRPNPPPAAALDLAAIRSRCPVEMARVDCYRHFHELGLDYGPSFQGIVSLWRGDGECLGKIEIPEAVRDASEKRPMLHPAAVDACIQVILGTLSPSAAAAARGVYLPVSLAEVRSHGTAGPSLWSYARLVERGRDSIVADVCVCDDSGKPVWEARGLRCQEARLQAKGAGSAQDDLLHECQWKLEPLPPVAPAPGSPAKLVRSVAHLPRPEQLTPALQDAARRLLAEHNLQTRNAAFQKEADKLCAAYAWSALQQLGADFHSQQRFSVPELVQRLGIGPERRRILERYLNWLEEEGILGRREESWEVLQIPSGADPQTTWRDLLHRYPAFAADLMLLGRCGPNLAQVFRGEIDPLELIFPEGSLGSAEQYYQDSLVWRFYNLMAQESVARLAEQLPEGRSLRVLEIGAGTGAMTSYVLPRLPADRTDYVFTDLSNHFFSKAEQKLRDYPFVRYQRLDIEKDPAEQGFENHSFDVIVASLVLHATANLRETLDHVRQLLAPGGWLLILEIVRPVRLIDLVFGLLEGWWRFADFDRRPAHPLLDWAGWQNVLQESGFSEMADLSASQEQIGNALIAVRGPEKLGSPGSLPAPSAETESPRPEQPGTWLLFADRGNLAEKLAGRLTAHGQCCVLVHPGERFQRRDDGRYEIAPQSSDDMERLLAQMETDLPPCRGIVHLWNLDAPVSESLTPENLEPFQEVGCLSVVQLARVCSDKFANGTRLILVTRQAQGVDRRGEAVALAQAPVHGLGRVIINEMPRLRCRLVDLGGVDEEAELQGLFEELRSDTEEDEVALRGPARYVYRYRRTSLDKYRLEVPHRADAGPTPFRLETSPGATLEGLTLRACPRRKPAAGEVEIQVFAAGLNFSDIMKALGLYPALPAGPVPLGLECSGKITALGEGVREFQIGDEVIAIASFSFSALVTVPAGLVVRKPGHLSFEEAATLPVAFLTAYHALHHLGHMEAGDRVLIHSASGGVGLAALQLARAAGALVFATAGTAEKRDFLRDLGVEHVMDSRSLGFADEVLKQTEGRGVDLLLNSLAGEAIAKGLSVLADYGRFLEIGKRDIYMNSKLGMYPFRKNVSFIAIDLDRGIRERPQAIARQFREVTDQVRQQKLAPLPHRVFPLSNLIGAFRYLAQGKHIGKVVLSFRGEVSRIAPASEPPPLCRPEGTYLITGGLGGFGLAVARWLAGQGARRLVLVGRSGAASPEAEQAVGELRTSGVDVVVAKADVSKPSELAAVLAQIEAEMPLRGIIHGAMVLDDCLLDKLTPERWRRVLAPKMLGAWNLHCLTQHQPLDFFVCFSSMSAIFGVAGQGNYCAANSFLDALAHYRRSRGLPGLTINWGYLGEVGYVARNEKIGERFASWGVRSFSPREGLDLLGQLLHHPAVQAGVMRIDWGKWRPPGATDAVPPRFRDLCSAARSQQDELIASGVPLRSRLLEVDVAERSELLQAVVRDKVARVLGAAASNLDINKPINELGLDSLMGVELRNWIEDELRVNVPLATLTQGLSVVQLTNALLGLLAGESPAAPAPSPEPKTAPTEPSTNGDSVQPNGQAPAPLAERVDELSNEEVDQLLATMLSDPKKES